MFIDQEIPSRMGQVVSRWGKMRKDTVGAETALSKENLCWWDLVRFERTLWFPHGQIQGGWNF